MPVYQTDSNKWYINLMIRGQRYHRAVPEATSKKDAEKAEIIIKAQLLQGKYSLVEGIGEMPFPKLNETYKEYIMSAKKGWKEEQSKIRKLSAFFGKYKLKEITPDLISRYRSERQRMPKKNGKPLSGATINREVSILSKMLSIALENGWILSNPCRAVKKLKEETKLERYLQSDEEERLLNNCVGSQTYMKPILICALHTGMRRGEILNLKWVHVNLQEGFITVTMTKSGKNRNIPISPALTEHLKELCNNKQSEYVFTNPITQQPYKDIKKSFLTLCSKSGIDKLRFHDLRHTAATRMVAMGVELIIVQDILGHSQITTTMRYAHPVPERKRMAIEALARFK